MQEVSRDIFYQTTASWEEVPFSQTEGYVRLQSGDRSERVRYYLDEQVGCAAHVKRFAGLTMLMTDGECLRHRETKPATLTRFYEALQQCGADMIELNSRRPYQADYEIGLRQAGFLRPVGSFSFQLTNRIDLTQPLRFNENWKRNLKDSEGAGLQLERPECPTEQDIADVMRLYREMSAHKHLAIPFTPALLRILLNDPHFRLCFIARGKERLSMLIYHQSGTHAGLLYAANGAQANEAHAGFRLYEQLLNALAEEGVHSFDMEKMGASAHSTNAVFLFKQGIRGELTPLCGEWSWYQRPWLGPAMYFVKKYLWKKTQA